MSATATHSAPRFIDRESARKTLEKKVAAYTKAIDDPNHFSTVDPRFILDDAVFRLRWIDCAPEGANHQTAPLADKTGTPMGGVFDENVGPGRAMREAWDRKRGYTGAWKDAKIAQHEARLAREAA
jgi:hypothetical protein